MPVRRNAACTSIVAAMFDCAAVAVAPAAVRVLVAGQPLHAFEQQLAQVALHDLLESTCPSPGSLSFSALERLRYRCDEPTTKALMAVAVASGELATSPTQRPW